MSNCALWDCFPSHYIGLVHVGRLPIERGKFAELFALLSDAAAVRLCWSQMPPVIPCLTYREAFAYLESLWPWAHAGTRHTIRVQRLYENTNKLLVRSPEEELLPDFAQRVLFVPARHQRSCDWVHINPVGVELLLSSPYPLVLYTGEPAKLVLKTIEETVAACGGAIIDDQLRGLIRLAKQGGKMRNVRIGRILPAFIRPQEGLLDACKTLCIVSAALPSHISPARLLKQAARFTAAEIYACLTEALVPLSHLVAFSIGDIHPTSPQRKPGQRDASTLRQAVGEMRLLWQWLATMSPAVAALMEVAHNRDLFGQVNDAVDDLRGGIEHRLGWLNRGRAHGILRKAQLIVATKGEFEPRSEYRWLAEFLLRLWHFAGRSDLPPVDAKLLDALRWWQEQKEVAYECSDGHMPEAADENISQRAVASAPDSTG